MDSVLERGDIFFLYRPVWREEEVQAGVPPVDRSYIVLCPDSGSPARLIALGRRRLPRGRPGPHRPGTWAWAVVDELRQRPEDLVRELEDRALAAGRPAPRAAGEGRYALVDHGDHTHLAFRLELPETPGPVQQALGIPSQGSYIVCVRSPQAPSPLDIAERPAYPDRIMEQFEGRRLAPLRDPRVLDYENTELLMAGPSDRLDEELDIQVDSQKQSAGRAEVFGELKLTRRWHPPDPLLQGEWR